MNSDSQGVCNMLVGFIKQIRNDQPAYVYKVAIEF